MRGGRAPNSNMDRTVDIVTLVRRYRNLSAEAKALLQNHQIFIAALAAELRAAGIDEGAETELLLDVTEVERI